MDRFQVFIGILPLLGVIVGGFITYLTQTRVFNKQVKRDERKEIEAKKIERLLVYNEVLKLEGEILMQSYIGGGLAEFNIEAYREKFRPLFYSKYHIINQDIAQEVRNMDRIIMAADFNEELDQEQNDSLLTIFHKIISLTEKYLELYRINNDN